jgi:hypothetical protein
MPRPNILINRMISPTVFYEALDQVGLPSQSVAMLVQAINDRQSENLRPMPRRPVGYGPRTAYGPFESTRSPAGRAVAAINEDTLQHQASQLENRIDPGWLNSRLREMDVPYHIRRALITRIDRDQKIDVGEVVDVEDVPGIFSEHLGEGNEKLRVKVPGVEEGWLTDARLAMNNEHFVSMVIEGKIYYVPVNGQMRIWTEWRE